MPKNKTINQECYSIEVLKDRLKQINDCFDETKTIDHLHPDEKKIINEKIVSLKKSIRLLRMLDLKE